MIKVFDTTIFYTVDKKHPDYKTLPKDERGGLLDFSDTYYIDECYNDDACITYIKNDLKLVAGGGYSTEHIHNVTFSINKRYIFDK